MGITINKHHSPATEFAYDGCHKIYLLDNGERDRHGDEAHLLDGYRILPVEDLPTIWNTTCPLRFISSWDLSANYAKQFEGQPIEFDIDH